MTNPSNRVRQLDQAKDVIANLEAEVGDEMSYARTRLCEASNHIRDDRNYERYVEQAMGRAAGEAIRQGYDDIAAAAAEVVESSEDDT